MRWGITGECMGAPTEALEDFEAFEQIEQLRESNRRLSAQLQRARVSKEELAAAVYRAARDAALGLTLNPVPKPTPDRRKQRTPEVAVAVLADWQLAKLTPSYNSDVCEERIHRYADKVLKLTDIQRADHPVREARIWCLGDLVEGELIFPGQAHQIDASLYRQVCVDGPRILGDFVRRMLGAFDKVRLVGVIGNHGALGGRSRREYNPTTNADRMLYRITAGLLEKETPRLTVQIPDSERQRDWYAIDAIGNYRTLLFHGDQIKGGFAGYPWYSFGRKLDRWRHILPGGFADSYSGHWHQVAKLPLSLYVHRGAGSPESGNEYAEEQMGGMSRPSQPLQFVVPDVGVSAEYTVYLD